MSYIHGSSPEEQRRLSALNEIINQTCLDQIEPDYGSRILDVGSGLGQFTRLLARTCRGTALGIERDLGQLEYAQSMLRDGDEVEYRQGDANDLPLLPDERGSFDLAHARFVLEHVPNPQRVVHQMVQAVRPRGRIFLLDDDHDLLKLDPEPAKFMTIWDAYKASYTKLGCDPSIGRKLPQLLYKAGALPLKASAIYFGACQGQESFDALCDNMAGIVSGAGELMTTQGPSSKEDLQSGLEEFTKWRKCEYANLVFIAPWAEGKRL